MNTMKGFYASISSAHHLHGSYLQGLSELTRITLQQAHSLSSDLAWQDWSQQSQETTMSTE